MRPEVLGTWLNRIKIHTLIGHKALNNIVGLSTSLDRARLEAVP